MGALCSRIAADRHERTMVDDRGRGRLASADACALPGIFSLPFYRHG
jgi:hypothetical protein